MPPETEIEAVSFQAFFAAKIKQRGMTLKKISEMTGIAPGYLESMMHGNAEGLPSSPYLHGYLLRLGKVLDFDGEVWWEKIKKEGFVRNSGSDDILPSNRFIKESPTKLIWIGVVAVLVVIYLAFQLPIIFGKPQLTITFPTQNPYTTTSSTLTIQGTVNSADSLSLNGDSINVAQDGAWQKTVLLQNGVNTFEISAKKLLGNETDITEEILYQGIGLPATSSASSTATSTSNSASTSSITSTK